MIKAEVVLDGDHIKIKNYTIQLNDENQDGIIFDIFKGKKHVNTSLYLEEAIKYCLEN